MATWIFPNKVSNYDVEADFKRIGKCDWFQNVKNIDVGDIVYIYLSSPNQQIRWKCVVEDKGYYLKKGEDFDREYVQSSIYCDGPCLEIVPLVDFGTDSRLSYRELKNHGLKSRLMGPQRVDAQLLTYIESVENTFDNQDLFNTYIQFLPSDMLKVKAQTHAQTVPTVKVVQSQQYSRNVYVAQYAKRRANGICQLCGCPAPFLDKNGQPYLESHHIVWLSRGGTDSINNVAALCPNCHRRMHVLDDQNDVDYLLEKIK